MIEHTTKKLSIVKNPLHTAIRLKDVVNRQQVPENEEVRQVDAWSTLSRPVFIAQRLSCNGKL